jgi:hypothetical protein
VHPLKKPSIVLLLSISVRHPHCFILVIIEEEDALELKDHPIKLPVIVMVYVRFA